MGYWWRGFHWRGDPVMDIAEDAGVALGSLTSDPILGFIDILSSFDTGTDNDKNSNSCDSSLHG